MHRCASRGERRSGPDAIRIHNAREHNLKNIDVAIPRDRFTVVTGVSGSGKSTLAFDILFAEGQRRYLESLNAYARQFVQPASRPDVDAIFGIPPTVAIEQRTSRGGRKSTVATLTEIYHFLRLLYVKLGTQHCPDCDVPIEPQSEESIAARLLRDYAGSASRCSRRSSSRARATTPTSRSGRRARASPHLRVDGAMLPTQRWPRLDRFKEHTIELPVARAASSPPENEPALRERARARARIRQGRRARARAARSTARWQGRAAVARGGVLDQARLPVLRPQLSRARPAPVLVQLEARLVPDLLRHRARSCAGFDDEQTGDGDLVERMVRRRRRGLSRLRRRAAEPRGARRALSRPLDRRAHAARRSAMRRASSRELDCAGREAEIARDIVAELALAPRAFSSDVGLGYLALDRSAPTLSGGEAQRIRLAAQLGSNLRGVCYILDEPTIGLHPRDNRILLDTLAKLEAKGNTLVVVEHDEDTIRRADHVIDLGPGAGKPRRRRSSRRARPTS